MSKVLWDLLPVWFGLGALVVAILLSRLEARKKPPREHVPGKMMFRLLTERAVDAYGRFSLKAISALADAYHGKTLSSDEIPKEWVQDVADGRLHVWIDFPQCQRIECWIPRGEWAWRDK